MMNYVVIMGRLTADPELRQTADGIPYCNVTVAVERDHRKDAENKVDFIPVTSWRNTAEFICRNFVKGQMIAVHGSLRINTYEKDGEKRYITSVNADKLFFAGGADEESFTIIPDTQEAIISREEYEKAKKRRKSTKRVIQTREKHLLDDMVFCNECGRKMYLNFRKYAGGNCYVYICDSYRKKKGCTSHYVQAMSKKLHKALDILRSICFEEIRYLEN